MVFLRNLGKCVKSFWVIGLLLLLASVGWALDGLEAQTNKSAANAGGIGEENVSLSIDSIKEPKATASKPAPPVDWAQERAVKKQLASQEKTIGGLVAQAKNQQAAGGSVAAGLANQLKSAGDNFLATSQKYSDIWAKGKCTTRANLALDAGKAMVASIDVVISGADGDKISAFKSSQSELDKARRAYFKEAVETGELSAQDKAELRKNLVPRANKLVQEAAGLVTEVTSLLNQIRSQVGSLTSPGAVAGTLSSCAGGGGGGPENIAQKLLSPVTNLLSVAQGLAMSAKDLVSDLGTLG
ncbi:MAG: hypothetical protein LBS60_11185 [Deltaproteobacteria bacterium]|jgi:hypothetical protein|nr:hypothetical protein [Deltaproteobacteria bacterium]